MSYKGNMEKETIEIIGGLIVLILTVYGLINLGMLIFGITTSPIVEYLKSENKKSKERRDRTKNQMLKYFPSPPPLRESPYAAKVLHVASLLYTGDSYDKHIDSEPMHEAIDDAIILISFVDERMDSIEKERHSDLMESFEKDTKCTQTKPD